ncbi:MAG: ABC transporter permease, partial [Longimicrobiales bacterium]
MPLSMPELRGALRAALRSPALSALVVVTLGLGIGANAAVFSVLNAVLLQPLPYEHGDRLVELRQHDGRDAAATLGVSATELGDYRAGAGSLDELVEYHTMWFNLLGMGDPERVQTGVVSANYFDVLGIVPVLGRGFVAGDDALDAAPVLVLGYGYWQRRFGGDRDVIGRTVEMNDRSHTIVGVMPPIPQYPNDNDVWMPWSACPFRSSDHARTNRAMRMLTVFGRLAPGATVAAAGGDVMRVAGAMHAEDPASYPESGITATIEPLREAMVGEARPRFLLLLGTAGLVLLLACANVANLLLARASRREHELAVRAALGAGRGRLVRQIVVESLALALAGAALG